MGQTEITPEVLAQRLDQILELAEEVKALRPEVTEIRNRQNADTWSTVPSPSTFSLNLSTSLGTVNTNLDTSVTDLTTLHEELTAYAREMNILDEGVAERLKAIKSALDAAS